MVSISTSRSPSPVRHNKCFTHRDHERIDVKIYNHDKGQVGQPTPALGHARAGISKNTMQLPKPATFSRCCQHRIPSAQSLSSTAQHVSDMGPAGGTDDDITLEDLVEAAMQACKRARQSAATLPEAVGASLLCNNGDVFLSCSSGEESGFSTRSAERAVLRKALREGHCPPFQALVLAIDAVRDPAAFPVPDKKCYRSFGFLPVFLVNQNFDIKSTTSSGTVALTHRPPSPPSHRSVQWNQRLPARTAPKRPATSSPTHKRSEPNISRSFPGGPHSWSSAQVLDWLLHVVKLPQYKENFLNARVDGHTLFHIYNHEVATAGRTSPESKSYHRTHQYHACSRSSSALEDTLLIYNPAHKRRLLDEIQELKYGRCVPSISQEPPSRTIVDVRPENPIQRREGTHDNFYLSRGTALEENDDENDDTSTLQRRDKCVKAMAAAVGSTALGDARRTRGNPLKQLSRAKKVFDEHKSTVGASSFLTGAQTLAGLQVFGCNAAQDSIRDYFKRRSIHLKSANVDFYEFLRAVLALGSDAATGLADTLPVSKAMLGSATLRAKKEQHRARHDEIKDRLGSAPRPAQSPPPPSRPLPSAYSSSSYSSSSFSCSQSQCSVSSLSEAEVEEANPVTSIHSPARPTPLSALPAKPTSSPCDPSPTKKDLPLPCRQGPGKEPPASTSLSSPTRVQDINALSNGTAPQKMEESKQSLSDEACDPLPAPEPALQKKLTQIPPLTTTISAIEPSPLNETSDKCKKLADCLPQAVIRGGGQAQGDKAKAPPSTRPPDQPGPLFLKRRIKRPSSSNSSLSSHGSSSKSYVGSHVVAQVFQKPSLPSIASLSTTTTASQKEPRHQEICHEQQQREKECQSQQDQRPDSPPPHRVTLPNDIMSKAQSLDDSVIASIEEEEVPSVKLQSLSSHPGSPCTASSMVSLTPRPLHRVGARVEARYQGEERWFPGEVIRVHGKGEAFDVHYDDDDIETHISPDLIRSHQLSERRALVSPSLAAAHAPMAFGVGDRVEARYRGREIFYSGVIAAVHAEEGAYEIHYDDGDVEERVAAALLRPEEDDMR